MLRAIVSELEEFSNPFKKYVVVLIETIPAPRGRLKLHESGAAGRCERADAGERGVAAGDGRDLHQQERKGEAGSGPFLERDGRACRTGLAASLVRLVEVEAGGAFALDARQNLPAENDGTAVEAALAHLKATASRWPAGVAFHVFYGWYAKKTFVDGVGEQ